ncbi:MAG: hypothetical protein L3J79_02835 [Candidatus Marinimicrobia bacterium]|nr:hypothetical protein [Candidatus Neomarinimicrobiota bacterium]
MMTLILDSSEIREALSLATELLTAKGILLPEIKTDDDEGAIVKESSLPEVPMPVPAPELPVELKYRSDRLEHVVVSMCQRSGFIGAVVTDDKGLPFVIINPPVSEEALSAFTSVLGEALERAGSLLGAHGAEYLSIDINYEDKIVLRRFLIDATTYYLMVICSQDIDERSEIELSIEQLTAILADQ